MTAVRMKRRLAPLWPVVASGLVLAAGCGGTERGIEDASPAGASAGTGGGMAQVAGQAGAAAMGGAVSAAGGGRGGALASGGGATSGGGASSAGAAPCIFQTPQCPNAQAPCEQIGVVQDCYAWQVCHSAPAQAICCASGWELGQQCASGAGGAGGANSDPCGGCDAAQLQTCVYQAGGPGPSRFTCATQTPCKGADVCACIADQGTCNYQAGGSTGYCACDNALD